MPIAAKHPCNQSGCRELLPLGTAYCPKHAKQRVQQDARERGTSWQRGIDAKWRALRKAHFERDPWCAECRREGREVPAAILHHIVEHRGDERLRLDPANLVGLCRRHHGIEHARRGLPGYRAPGGGNRGGPLSFA